MHGEGLNLRYLGHLFQHCQTLHAKALLCSEAVARVCKHICMHAQKKVLRKGRAMSMAAETTKASSDAEYKEFNASLLEENHRVVVDCMNQALGCGERSRDFWKRILPPLLRQRFNMILGRDPRDGYIHKPQLLSALQYHLSVVVEMEISDIDFNSPEPVPFERVRPQEPKLKWKENTKLPLVAFGLDAEGLRAGGHHQQAMKMRLLRAKLLKEAYGTTKLNVSDSHGMVSLMSSYVQNQSYKEAMNLANDFLSSVSGLFPCHGLMRMRLMAAKYKAGERARAIEEFDTARRVLEFTLGKHHPYIYYLLISLGDLYYKDGYFSEALAVVQEAYVLAEKSLGSSHILCAVYAKKLGAILSSAKAEPSRPIQAFERALAVYMNLEEQGGEHGAAIADCWFALAEVMMNFGMFEDALQPSKRCLEIREKRADPALNDTYLQLGILGERMCDQALARESYEKLLYRIKKEGNAESLVDVQALTKKILACYIKTQPYHLRMALQSYAVRVVPTLSLALVEKVLLNLWMDSPTTYIEGLIQKMYPVAEDPNPEVLKEEGGDNDIIDNDFLQFSVLQELVCLVALASEDKYVAFAAVEEEIGRHTSVQRGKGWTNSYSRKYQPQFLKVPTI